MTRPKTLRAQRGTAVPGCPGCEPLPPFDETVGEREHPGHTHPNHGRAHRRALAAALRDRWQGISRRRWAGR